MIEAPQILLNHRLKSLRLPTVLREYGKLAKQAAAEGLDSHDASDPEMGWMPLSPQRCRNAPCL